MQNNCGKKERSMLNQEIQFFINVCSLSDLGALYRFYAPNCVYLTCEKSSIRSSTVFILSSNIMNIRTFNQEINKAWEGLRQSVNCIYKIYRGTKRCIITPPFSIMFIMSEVRTVTLMAVLSQPSHQNDVSYSSY